jgi:hypothetical protein
MISPLVQNSDFYVDGIGYRAMRNRPPPAIGVETRGDSKSGALNAQPNVPVLDCE